MEHAEQLQEFINVASRVFPNADLDSWELQVGLDPANRVWDNGYEIVKITKIQKFYSEMHMQSLIDIHSALAPLNVAPRLDRIEYREPFLISVYEKLDDVGIPSAAEAGESLAKAHCALAEIPIQKAFPWVGFYGEPEEFRFLIPLVKDDRIRSKAELLVEKVKYRTHTEPVHYIHRDLHPGNLIKSSSGVYLVDWDMAHGGHRIDDVAMSLCCLAPMASNEKSISAFCNEFLKGYRRYIPVDWAESDSPVMISAIAVAGLRQAVGGWFTDKGDLSAWYWPNLLKRLDASIELCKSV